MKQKTNDELRIQACTDFALAQWQQAANNWLQAPYVSVHDIWQSIYEYITATTQHTAMNAQPTGKN